jgi:hypothetical protein
MARGKKVVNILILTTLGLANSWFACLNAIDLDRNLESDSKITARQEQTDSIKEREVLEEQKEGIAYPLGLGIANGLMCATAFTLVGVLIGQKIRE